MCSDFIITLFQLGVNMKTHIYEVCGGEKLTLREMRCSALLKQEEVAKKLTVDQSAISNWERGTTRPLRKYHKKLAKLYGVTVEQIETAICESTVTEGSYDAE